MLHSFHFRTSYHRGKEAVKHLCGAFGAKSYKRVIKED